MRKNSTIYPVGKPSHNLVNLNDEKKVRLIVLIVLCKKRTPSCYPSEMEKLQSPSSMKVLRIFLIASLENWELLILKTLFCLYSCSWELLGCPDKAEIAGKWHQNGAVLHCSGNDFNCNDIQMRLKSFIGRVPQARNKLPWSDKCCPMRRW